VEPSGRTIKNFITAEIKPEHIVYERVFSNSLSQQKRDSYFLTELYNVKSLIRHQQVTEDEGFDMKVRTALLKGMEPSKQANAPYFVPKSPEDKTLVFESRFESGNLCMAIKESDNEYNLLMQNDVNTGGHTQWFFFRVTNTKAGSTIKFNILNFVRKHILIFIGKRRFFI
jgi:hypothetical protein